MDRWTFEDIPDQRGRVAIVTGASSGIGFETARMLAAKGADVVLACRHPERGVDALERIEAEEPAGRITLLELDLADLDKVAHFVTAFGKLYRHVDLLINNAGIMLPTPPDRTVEGFELQFGTNHLGHFALTGRLLPYFIRRRHARVVTLSSIANGRARIVLDDLNWERRLYNGWRAYSQSKLANLMFALELQRRLTAVGSPAISTAAHPGWTATELRRTMDLTRLFNPLFAMKAPDGALPTLRAATDPEAKGGSYWGPAGRFELNGPPEAAHLGKRAKDAGLATHLWEASEQLTDVAFRFTERRQRVRTAA